VGWFAERLARADERNQEVADFQRNHPEAGTEMFPGAKSRFARRILAASLVVQLAVTFVFVVLFGVLVGILVGLVVAFLMGFLVRRYEHRLVGEDYLAETRRIRERRRW